MDINKLELVNIHVLTKRILIHSCCRGKQGHLRNTLGGYLSENVAQYCVSDVGLARDLLVTELLGSRLRFVLAALEEVSVFLIR